MPSSFLSRLFLFHGFVALVAVLTYTGVFQFPQAWFYEQGPIEISSVCVLLLASMMTFLNNFLEKPKRLALGWLLFAIAMRELDMDKTFTSQSVFKSKFYASGTAQPHEIVIGILMILGVLWVFWHTFKYTFDFARKLRRLDAVSLIVASAIGYIALGRFIDTMPRVAPWVRDHVMTGGMLNMVLEESFEHLGYALFLFAAVYCYKLQTQEAIRDAAKRPAAIAVKTKTKKKTRR